MHEFYKTAEEKGLKFEGSALYDPNRFQRLGEGNLVLRLYGKLLKEEPGKKSSIIIGNFSDKDCNHQGFTATERAEIDYLQEMGKDEYHTLWYNVDFGSGSLRALNIRNIHGKSPGIDSNLKDIISGNDKYTITDGELILPDYQNPNAEILSRLSILPNHFYIGGAMKEEKIELTINSEFNSTIESIQLSAQILAPYPSSELIDIALKLRSIIDAIAAGKMQGKYTWMPPKDRDTSVYYAGGGCGNLDGRDEF